MAPLTLLLFAIPFLLRLALSYSSAKKTATTTGAAALSPCASLLKKQRKTTHLHFFFHDILSGPNPTAVRVAVPTPSDDSLPFFGTVVVAEDPLTEGPELTSKVIGKAQGIYAIASKKPQEMSIMMSFSYVFTDGELAGSSLVIQGTNMVMEKVREMPVVGGTGKFRMATGYALATTHKADPATGDATVEYDVYVMHQ